MKTSLYLFAMIIATSFIAFSSWAAINQVRVINETKKDVHVHVGGYSSSKTISPKKWKIFKYPFIYKKPGSTGHEENTGLLVVTAGGFWYTTPNGFTYLKDPELVQCINYNDTMHHQKSGNRVWIIKALNVDHYCYRDKLKGYQQIWYTPP
jgi:hypothetical protein